MSFPDAQRLYSMLWTAWMTIWWDTRHQRNPAIPVSIPDLSVFGYPHPMTRHALRAVAYAYPPYPPYPRYPPASPSKDVTGLRHIPSGIATQPTGAQSLVAAPPHAEERFGRRLHHRHVPLDGRPGTPRVRKISFVGFPFPARCCLRLLSSPTIVLLSTAY